MIVDERYERGDQLGQGAFGRTFRARSRQTGQDVVIKQLKVQGLPDWKPVEHFEREAKVLGSLDHSGVPRFVEALQHENEGGVDLFLVTEYVQGPTLRERIEAGTRWDESKALALMVALLQTLDYLHRLSPPVIHRDIKPGNIVLREGEEPVLIDFGAVRDLATRQPDGAMTVLGTPGYMAPEQALGQADARSDLYALGTTLVHAFTHSAPLDLPRTGMRLNFGHLLGLSPTIVQVLERMVEANPDDRFDRASEILDTLREPEPADADAALPATTNTSTGTALARVERPLPAALATNPRPMHRVVARRLTTGAAMSRMPVGHQVGLAIAPFILILILGIIGGATIGGPGALTGLFGGIAFGGLGLFRFLQKRALSHQRIYQTGEVCEGRVVSVRSYGPGSASLLYEYKVDDTWHEGTLTTNEAAATDTVRPGDALTIVYDADRPGDHVALMPHELPTDDD